MAQLLGLPPERLTMKNLFFFCLGLVCVALFSGLVLSGCNGGTSDSVKNAKDSNAAKIDSLTASQGGAGSSAILSKDDADFLVDAASGAMMEVQLGKLAETHATKRRIKDFGAMMVRDHGLGIEEIRHLASRRHVTLPDSVSEHQRKEIENLKEKKGEKFDRAYTRMMVDDHHADIKEFEKQASQGTDSLIRVFASGALQMLRRHLDSANNLQAMLGLNVNAEPMPAH